MQEVVYSDAGCLCLRVLLLLNAAFYFFWEEKKIKTRHKNFVFACKNDGASDLSVCVCECVCVIQGRLTGLRPLVPFPVAY